METMGSLCSVLSFSDVSLLVAPLLWIPRPVCVHLEWLTTDLQSTPQGYLHNPTFCHGVGLGPGVVILSTSGKAFDDREGIMLISEYFKYL